MTDAWLATGPAARVLFHVVLLDIHVHLVTGVATKMVLLSSPGFSFLFPVLFFSFLLLCTLYFVPGPRRYAPPFGHSWVLKSQVLTAMKFWQCEPTQ